MKLEKISVALRPRGPWEAIDLGFAMAHAHARAVWGAWAALVLPVHALVWLLLGRWPGVAMLLLWYLKPLFDRVPLAVLSRALFGEAPTPRAVLAALRQSPGGQVLRSLTWSRASPFRALQLPIWQLEGLRSRELARRERVLTRGADTGALGLLLAAGLLELCLTMAGIGTLMAFAPEDLGLDARSLALAFVQGDLPLWFTVASALSWTAATSVAEPLYVAGGFGLYLNRRTWLEGWDIELQLRRLAARLGGAALLLLALLGGAASAQAWDTGAPEPADEQVLPPDPHGALREAARAQAGEPVDPAPLRAALEEVLALPEMPHEQTRETWGLKGDGEQADLLPTFGGAGPLGAFLGEALRVLVIALVAVGVLALVRAMLRARRPAASPEEAADPQVRLPALLREAGPAPEDPAALARSLWREGRRAEALGVLYRGALLVLVSARGVSIPDGATESDCLGLLRGRLQAEEWACFLRLTRAWQAAAYAHRLPEDEEVDWLIDQWARWYGRPA